MAELEPDSRYRSRNRLPLLKRKLMNNPRNWYTEALIQGTMNPVGDSPDEWNEDEYMPLDPDDEDNYDD